MWSLYTDGGCKPNPGKSSYCAALYSNDELVESIGGFAGISTNNIAEYRALLAGLELLDIHCKPSDKIDVHIDSQLVINQVTNKWKVRHEDLIDICNQCKSKLVYFTNLSIHWVKGHSGNVGNNYVDSICSHYISTSDNQTTDVPSIEMPFNIPAAAVYINCPFDDKDAAKSLGAKWDSSSKMWWVLPENKHLFTKWL